MALIDLQTAREQRMPHLRGPATCLNCGHTWEAVTPAGTIVGLECSQCGTLKGVYDGFIAPDTRFVCPCGNDLYYLKPDGCMCLNCGLMAQGF